MDPQVADGQQIGQKSPSVDRVYGRRSGPLSKYALCVDPTRAQTPCALEEALEKVPRRTIVPLVMREPARRLGAVGAAGAALCEVPRRRGQRFIVPTEGARATPVDDVDVRIRLDDARHGRGPRTETGKTAHADGIERRQQGPWKTIPWGRQHRQKRRAGKPSQTLASLLEAA